MASLRDVLLVQLPKRDPKGHEQEGTRPVIVVGLPDNLGKTRFPVLVVVPLTTQTGKWLTTSPKLYPVLGKGQGGLPLSSVALLDQVASLDATRVLRKIGRLSVKEFAPIHVGLKSIFNL
jgi:mRNA interferase MazF